MTSRPRRAREALRGSGLAPLDAELLLGHVLSVPRARLHLDDPPLSSVQAERFIRLAERRREGEPVAYLVGRREFRWLSLAVDARVLIPRPETEHLVEAALTLPRGARVVDVGTGSGAVALALRHERPDLRVVGVDVSEDALAVARANGARLGLEVEWRRGDLLEPVDGAVDAVVANLPYVAEGAPVEEGVGFEPPVAVWAGADGLEVIRRLVGPITPARRDKERHGRRGLIPFVALEVGQGQAAVCAELLRAAGYARAEVIPDLANIPRVVVARA